MKITILLLLLTLMMLPICADSQEIYRWVDEKGTVHFTDDPSLVPEKYFDQVQKRKSTKEPTSPTLPPPLPIPRGGEPPREPESALEPKDALGRGKDWWQAKVKEWNEKLLKAQKNYENAYAAWKAKEKELEESLFKPDSLKRRLKAESVTLEEKVRDWEKQMEEARNMLEKVLPKEAEDYRADPSWLKIN